MPRRRVADPRLTEFRSRLARIDRAIVQDLRTREQVQQQLLAYKQRQAIPVFDRAQERIAARRAREWAERSGGDPDLAERVIRSSIAAGKRQFVARGGDRPVRKQPRSRRASSMSPRGHGRRRAARP